jgi:hypothetical protein
MPTDENVDSSILGRRPLESALQLGPRKKALSLSISISKLLTLNKTCSAVADPLIHHGRHFGRTVHALCSVHALLTNGVLREVELSDRAEEDFTAECVSLTFY